MLRECQVVDGVVRVPAAGRGELRADSGAVDPPDHDPLAERLRAPGVELERQLGMLARIEPGVLGCLERKPEPGKILNLNGVFIGVLLQYQCGIELDLASRGGSTLDENRSSEATLAAHAGPKRGVVAQHVLGNDDLDVGAASGAHDYSASEVVESESERSHREQYSSATTPCSRRRPHPAGRSSNRRSR